jgi:2C-methyl-D-erythritol 2,4-cyclodiphosphate synthase
MTELTVIPVVDLEAELDALAYRYAKAGGIGIDLLNSLGAQADGLIQRLPKGAQDGLQDATVAALNHAMTAAYKSRDMVPDQAGWLNSAIGAAMGAVGGFGGLPTALAELPVTTTLLLRVINGVAAEHGFDPSEENVRFDCVHVFAAAGPLEHDDGADIGFLSARMALSGAAMQGIIARVAPRLATVLGQKLAAQAVPVLGAVAGAATNYAYTSYYTDMAHVHFGLRRLAIDADQPREVLVEKLRARLDRAPVKRA